ncbi:hypothetical protein SCAR479_00454 [Seiridium cardinale]|uniref:Uncharacterized protein n=1 Tax=Seiridium cardinale TaxID=138064 RepID=A0ABR2Y9R1_9PEZI
MNIACQFIPLSGSDPGQAAAARLGASGDSAIFGIMEGLKRIHECLDSAVYRGFIRHKVERYSMGEKNVIQGENMIQSSLVSRQFEGSSMFTPIWCHLMRVQH